MKKNLLYISLFISCISLAQTVDRNTEPLITDRPDATESPYTVGKGNFQIETGALFTDESFEDTDIKTSVYNTALLRYGLSNNFELRLGWDYQKVNSKFGGNEIFDATGFNPLLVGAKIEITNEDGWIPQIGLIGHLRLPFTAVSEFKPEDTGMDFLFSFDHTLNDRAGLAYNLGARIGDDRSLEYIYSLAYGYSITEKIGAYAEVYGFFPESDQAGHLWDAGMTYLVNNNLQLDATIGTGFQGSNTNQDLLFSFGFSYRILKN
ncbi:transporter [Nonlabens mediterrranea]|uniref:Transporter n=1 Tax=Nonlabens mediterrranea TaxID=1419947 RepID=A0ABS0A5L3_9FLAO|nr:transporter [Nonlabens mediterrranea]